MKKKKHIARNCNCQIGNERQKKILYDSKLKEIGWNFEFEYRSCYSVDDTKYTDFVSEST